MSLFIGLLLVIAIVSFPLGSHAYVIYPQYFPQYNPFYDPTPYPAAPAYIPQYNPYYDPNPYDNLGPAVPQYNPYYSPNVGPQYGAKALRGDLNRIQTVGQYPYVNCHNVPVNRQVTPPYPPQYYAYQTYPPGYPTCPPW